MSATRSDKLRDDLDAEKAELLRRLSELEADGTAAPDFDENFADSAQVAAEQGENMALAATLRDQLEEVDGALTRLEDGSYGRCVVCGQEIAAARLEAMPATAHCIEHA